MDKYWYESKTLWGFGLLSLGLIGRYLNLIPENTFTDVLNVVFGMLGVYGLRDAL